MVLNASFFKGYKIPILLVLSSILFYFSFGYDLVRTDYTKLIMLYVALFFLFYKLVQILKYNLKFLTWIAFGFRAIFILAIPNLSQDFYRFIWDGRIILEGFNPYLFTVESFISVGEFPVAQAQELYNGMGELNASHYTNYPPINQLCFAIAGLFAGKSILGAVIIMRLLIIAADFGILFFGKKLLSTLNIPAYNIFWYILNPFIIIELTGNLHFEAVMIFFLVWSLYLLHSGKWKWAAVVFALSVSVKLIPLLFLPLFYKWFMKNKEVSTALNLTKLISFYAIIGITTLVLFLPFYSSEFINNYTQTVALWFQNFEFNASLYYLVREIGYLFRGWNEIAIIGKIIPFVVILFVIIVTFFRKNKTMIELITAMLLVLSFYYFASTTVHPWYIATLLFLSVFTKYKFPLVWSFIIIISYLAYANSNNTENLWVIGFEYLVVYGVFIWEVFFRKEKDSSLCSE
jgi:alpha-1,6-mannosyltransferase